MVINDFDEICNFLEDKGFTSISMKNGNKQIYVNKDKTINVILEMDTDRLTLEDEEKIKERLRALGYLEY